MLGRWIVWDIYTSSSSMRNSVHVKVARDEAPPDHTSQRGNRQTDRRRSSNDQTTRTIESRSVRQAHSRRKIEGIEVVPQSFVKRQGRRYHSRSAIYTYSKECVQSCAIKSPTSTILASSPPANVHHLLLLGQEQKNLLPDFGGPTIDPYRLDEEDSPPKPPRTLFQVPS